MAVELYKKTLADYKASLSKGDSVNVSKYCKKNEWVSWRGSPGRFDISMFPTTATDCFRMNILNQILYSG